MILTEGLIIEMTKSPLEQHFTVRRLWPLYGSKVRSGALDAGGARVGGIPLGGASACRIGKFHSQRV